MAEIQRSFRRSTLARTIRERGSSAGAHVYERARETLRWATEGDLSLLTIALDHLTLGRTTLYQALLVPDRDVAPLQTSQLDLTKALQYLDAAVDGLHRAGHTDYLPHGLLSRAWLSYLQGSFAATTTDLDATAKLALRCSMPICLADVHLTRARLFRDPTELAKARELLLDLRARGYHRHDDMFADAEEAARSWL